MKVWVLIAGGDTRRGISVDVYDSLESAKAQWRGREWELDSEGRLRSEGAFGTPLLIEEAEVNLDAVNERRESRL